MNGKLAKKVRREVASAQRAYLAKHRGETTITLRHRILFNVLRFAARIGFPVKSETIIGVARRGARLVLRSAA